MKTFFCRHGSRLDIDNKTYMDLWENNLAGVHFPEDINGWSEVSDSEEIEPEKYEGSAKKAMNAMKKLSNEGGYICAVYEPFNPIKVAKVSPSTRIFIFQGKWGKKNNLSQRIAKLKVIKLEKVRILKPEEAIVLRVAQPRQGTFCEWRAIGNKVMRLVEGQSIEPQVEDLTPTLQEVFCAEFLRLNWSEFNIELPQLQSFLMPVGRTMKDVDIVGITSNSKLILGQVTYRHYSGSKFKIDALKKYENANKILFCRNDYKIKFNDIKVVCIKKAFELFKDTQNGKNWIKKICAT